MTGSYYGWQLVNAPLCYVPALRRVVLGTANSGQAPAAAAFLGALAAYQPV